MLAWISPLIAPAVVAAVISSLVAIVGFWFNARTARAMHAEKLAFDRDLAERKFEFDKDLAERKFSHDRSLNDHKRRVELAEEVLADFYKAQSLLRSVRSPFTFSGEGASRKRDPEESDDAARRRDAIFAPWENLSKDYQFFSELQSRRYRFMAMFGTSAGEPFSALLQANNDMAWATHVLLDGERTIIDSHLRQKCEGIIWRGPKTDPFQESIDEAVSGIEAICRPIFQVRVT